jgi:hypothetical protein
MSYSGRITSYSRTIVSVPKRKESSVFRSDWLRRYGNTYSSARQRQGGSSKAGQALEFKLRRAATGRLQLSMRRRSNETPAP